MSLVRVHSREFADELLSPSGIIGKDIGEFDTGAWLNQHVGHCVAPLGIVRRFLVPGAVVLRAVNFDQSIPCVKSHLYR